MTDPETLCMEEGDFRDQDVIDHRRGIPSSAAGDYQCFSCNDVGTSAVNFTVDIQGRMIMYALKVK